MFSRLNRVIPIVALSLGLLLSVGCSREDARGPATTAESEVTASTLQSSSPFPYASITAEQLQSHCSQAEEGLRSSLEKLENMDGPYTEEGFLDQWNTFEIRLTDEYSRASTLSQLHPDGDLRTTAEKCVVAFNALVTDAQMSRPLYERFLRVSEQELAADSRHYVEGYLQDFRLNGVDKDEAIRARLKQLNEEILEAGQTFGRNIREDVRSVQVAPERLAGLPEDFLASHPPGEDGMVTITTRYPDFGPVMKYAQDDALRRELMLAFHNRAYPDNKPVLKELLRLRRQRAELLGFDNFVDLNTADKMAGNSETVAEFLDLLGEQVRDGAGREYQRLLTQLRQQQPGAEQVHPWQGSYLMEKVRQREYQLDAQQLRQYFAYGRVRDGIFQLVSDLFAVEFKPWDTPVWHSSVEAYEMWSGDQLVGRFFLDMHPREGKYQHAAAFPIQVGVRGQQPPIMALGCNFPGEGDPGALMEFQQVETFLHEFGHLIHGMFAGHQRWAGLSGISTERDFVEAPSQMLEEWVWDYQTLQSFAVNSEGEVLPDALYERMVAARDFGLPLDTSRQLVYAALSYKLYEEDPEAFDLDERSKAIEREYSVVPPMDDTHMYASFGHLTGYASNYYTYQWSLAIAADMFSRFEREGMRNPIVAAEYRDKVLSAGGSRPARDLVHDFLGRDYSLDAYVARLQQASGNETGNQSMRAEL
ncbi:M3 family metallopeptidase [Microbulbifer guangxiensis]|uniref:M3 family metallopeptidase n=1 Tax=Microbulbifer guangxiensis TaxID=2904249 RepID=UPI001F46B697|nr:M3 family metallopeptidase [Microbulbifer guangxiensis]